ncbi:MAG TPA: hypothetical protein VL485_31610 [Ktedonobacteraceae bacterium]|jgi:preprotein translocase subunit YajC|nr:hypothetical protein [Ktedonobacteraceae bacterium]
MLQFLPIFLIIIAVVCVFGYMNYRDAEKRAKEKKRNQYNDRV